MTILFFVPLTWIAMLESRQLWRNGRHATSRISSAPEDDNEVEDSANRDPEVDEDGKLISKVPFEELVKQFPNVHMVRLHLVYSTSAPDIRALKERGI